MDDTFCTPDHCDSCPERVVCHCLQVTEEALVTALQQLELRTLRDVREATGAGDGCTACHRRLHELLARHNYSASPICSVK